MFNTKSLIIFIGCVVLIFFAVFSGFQSPITNAPPKNLHIIAFGDSLVFGVGSEHHGGFVPILSKKLNISIDNFGVSGDTTSDGLLRLEADVLARNPGIVLVLLGGNDYIKRYPKEETFDNLRIIINKIQDTGAVTVVLGVKGGLLLDKYDTSYKKLARDTGSVYVENVLSGLMGDSEYMYDSIHPNTKGYELIADKIYNQIEFLIE